MTRIVTIARNLRRGQTDAERKLWFRLRNRRVAGLKFRRQMPLGRCIVDFCCESARLVIEVDGGQHSEVRDLARTRELETMGYLVLRFWNNDVLTNTDGVIESVLDTLHRLTLVPPHPSPPPTGEREQT